MTACRLLAYLRAEGYAPFVDGFELLLAADAPPLLVPAIELLATGLRAVLTGRPWYGIDRRTARYLGPFPLKTSGPLAFGALDPDKLLPRGVGLLCAGGDPEWDRVAPWAEADLPDCFAPPVPPPTAR